jgi:hypothetical protein
MPKSLLAELTATDVMNAEGPQGRTNVTVTVSGATGRLAVQNAEGTARSVHLFAVRDASDLGVGDTDGLSAEQARHVLALSCSLANYRVLFSTAQPDRVGPAVLIAPHQEPTASASDSTGNIVIQAPALHVSVAAHSPGVTLGFGITLDEVEVLSVARRLLAFRPFVRTPRARRDRNVLDAIDAYAMAAEAATPSTRLAALCPALEKAVNAALPPNQRDPSRCCFAAAAEKLTGVAAERIGQAWELNARLKHRQRDEDDAHRLEVLVSDLAHLLLDLKRAADAAIRARLP